MNNKEVQELLAKLPDEAEVHISFYDSEFSCDRFQPVSNVMFDAKRDQIQIKG